MSKLTGIATIIMFWALPEPEVDFSLTIFFAIMLSTDKPLIIIWLCMKVYKKFWGPTEIEEEKAKQIKYIVDSENVEVIVTKSQESVEAPVRESK